MISFKLYPSESEEDRLEIMIIEKIYPLIQDSDNNAENNRNKANLMGESSSKKKKTSAWASPNKSGLRERHSYVGNSNIKDTPSKNSIVNEKWENSDKYTQDLIQI